MLHGGSAVGRWTCDLQVAGSIPVRSAFTRHRSTQPCIPPGSLNGVPASAGGKGGILTSVGWQVTLCDPIWHVSFPYRWRAKLMLNCYTLFTYLLFTHWHDVDIRCLLPCAEHYALVRTDDSNAKYTSSIYCVDGRIQSAGWLSLSFCGTSERRAAHADFDHVRIRRTPVDFRSAASHRRDDDEFSGRRSHERIDGDQPMNNYMIIRRADCRRPDGCRRLYAVTYLTCILIYSFVCLFVCLIDGVGTVLFIALITRRSQSVITHAGKNPAWLAYGNIAFCLKTDTDPLWPWPLTFWP